MMIFKGIISCYIWLLKSPYKRQAEHLPCRYR